MKITIATIVILIGTMGVFAQPGSKVKDVLLNEIAFKNLSENRSVLQGEGGAITRFLEKVLQNPGRISIEDFLKEEKQYYSLVEEYNGIIDEIIQDVNSIERLKEVKNISLLKYEQRITQLITRMKKFITNLSKYNSEAFDPALIPTLIEIGGQVVKYFVNEVEERLKAIITTELENLKLAPISWEESRQAIQSGQAVPYEKVKLIVNEPRAEHYKTLELANGSSMDQIVSSAIRLKTYYNNQIIASVNEDVKGFFGIQLQKVETAHNYFIVNPPSALKPSHNPGGSNDVTTQNESTIQLKSRIQGFLDAAKIAGMSSDQIIQGISTILKEY